MPQENFVSGTLVGMTHRRKTGTVLIVLVLLTATDSTCDSTCAFVLDKMKLS